MRLIDADALLSLESVQKKGMAYIEEINRMPIVEAIPVEIYNRVINLLMDYKELLREFEDEI